MRLSTFLKSYRCFTLKHQRCARKLNQDRGSDIEKEEKRDKEENREMIRSRTSSVPIAMVIKTHEPTRLFTSDLRRATRSSAWKNVAINYCKILFTRIKETK